MKATTSYCNLVDLSHPPTELPDEQKQKGKKLNAKKINFIYICKYCYKIYAAKISLDHHLKSRHSSELPPKISTFGRPHLVKRGRPKKIKKIQSPSHRKISIPANLIFAFNDVVYELYHARIYHPLYCKLAEMQEPHQINGQTCDDILAEYLIHLAKTKKEELKVHIRFVIIYREHIVKTAREKDDCTLLLEQGNEVKPMPCDQILLDKEKEENIGYLNSWLLEKSYGALENINIL